MLAHHLLQLSDLRVERSDDADLTDYDGRVGALEDRCLTQPRSSQQPQQGVGLFFDVVTASGPQSRHELRAGQLGRTRRVRGSSEQ